MERYSIPHLAKLYEADCPGAVFVFARPATKACPPYKNNDFINDQKYLMDDYEEHIKSTDSDLSCKYKSIRFHRILAMFSGEIRLYSNIYRYPSELLINHWAEQFHADNKLQIAWADLLEPYPHLVSTPMQSIPAEQHAINADVLYELYSKHYLPIVDCPQAPVLDEPAFPCVLKVFRSNGGYGTWIIRSESEYLDRMNYISRTMPHAETILTDYVENVVKNYGVHLYVSKSGEVTWIGAAEQCFDSLGIWTSAVCYHDNQKQIKESVMPALDPLIRAIHEKEFFGMCCIDVLIDDNDRKYIVDLNPRWGAGAVISWGVQLLASKGYNVSIMVSELKFCGPLKQVLDNITSIDGGKVVATVAVSDDEDDTVLCELAIFAPSLDGCHRILEECKAMCAFDA